MTTITKTTAQAVSRFLAAKGFDKYDRWTEIGFSVMLDGETIRVVNHGYRNLTAALELAAAGYVVADYKVSEAFYTGRLMESFTIAGKAGN